MTFKPLDQLFKYDYRINNVISIEKQKLKTFKNLIDFSNSLKKYDYIIDLHSNLRSFIIRNFLKIKYSSKVIKYDKEGLKRRLNILNKNFNVVNAYLNTLKDLGIEDFKHYRPKIILSEDEIQHVKKFLPDNFIAIGTGARYLSKIYPYYDKVAKLILDYGFNVVLVGSKEDKDLDKNVYDSNVLDLRGKLTLRESLSVISLGKLTVSNDSAIAHMSRAVGVKVLMIYGSTHPYFGFAPLENEGTYIFKNLPCQPCSLHGKNICKFNTFECLTSIKPQEIFEKVKELLRA